MDGDRPESRISKSDRKADFHFLSPWGCPTFADVGGMHELESKVTRTVGALLAFPGDTMS